MLRRPSGALTSVSHCGYTNEEIASELCSALVKLQGWGRGNHCEPCGIYKIDKACGNW